MHYIKISDQSYQGSIHLHEILRFSGEVIGTYKEKYDKKTGIRTKQNIILENNVKEVTEDMIPGPFESKQDIIYNDFTGKIEYKTQTQKNTDKKEVLKKIMLEKQKEVNAGESLGLDMTNEKNFISSIKEQYDNL